MKKLTRDRVVPTISASVSWLIFGITTSGWPGFPEVGQEEKHARKPLLAGIEQVVDKVSLELDVAGKQVADEHLREGRLLVQHTDHFSLVHLHDRAGGQRGGAGHAKRLSCEAAFAKELTGFQDGDHRLLALTGDDRQLDLTLLDVEERVCRVALGKDPGLDPVPVDRSPAICPGKKDLWIESRVLPFRFHRHPASPQS